MFSSFSNVCSRMLFAMPEPIASRGLVGYKSIVFLFELAHWRWKMLLVRNCLMTTFQT